MSLQGQLLVRSYECGTGLRQFASDRLAERLGLAAYGLQIFAQVFALAAQCNSLIGQLAPSICGQPLDLIAQFGGKFFGRGIRLVKPLLRC